MKEFTGKIHIDGKNFQISWQRSDLAVRNQLCYERHD